MNNKVDVNSQLSRMKQLMNFGLNEGRKQEYTGVEYTKMAADGKLYGIIREGTKYYIKVSQSKKGKLAENFEYIGGFRNRKDNEYTSFANAQKHFDLKMMSINEANTPDKKVVVESWNPDKQEMLTVESTNKMRKEIFRERQIMANATAINERKSQTLRPINEKNNECCEGDPFCENPDSEFKSCTKDNIKGGINPVYGKTKKTKASKEAKTVKEASEPLAWHKTGGDAKSNMADTFMDKSHGTRIGKGSPFDDAMGRDIDDNTKTSQTGEMKNGVIEAKAVIDNPNNQNSPKPGTNGRGAAKSIDAPFDGENGRQIDEAYDDINGDSDVEGNDASYGGEGNDASYGGEGNDASYGGEGNFNSGSNYGSGEGFDDNEDYGDEGFDDSENYGDEGFDDDEDYGDEGFDDDEDFDDEDDDKYEDNIESRLDNLEDVVYAIADAVGADTNGVDTSKYEDNDLEYGDDDDEDFDDEEDYGDEDFDDEEDYGDEDFDGEEDYDDEGFNEEEDYGEDDDLIGEDDYYDEDDDLIGEDYYGDDDEDYDDDTEVFESRSFKKMKMNENRRRNIRRRRINEGGMTPFTDNGRVPSGNMNKLNDFGKHPAYQKKVMSLPDTDFQEFPDYYDMNDDSVKNTMPYGKNIGSGAPFEVDPQDVENAISEAIIRYLKKK